MEFKIGSVTIPGNVVLAPMAGITDLPFRIIGKENGAIRKCYTKIFGYAKLGKWGYTKDIKWGIGRKWVRNM